MGTRRRSRGRVGRHPFALRFWPWTYLNRESTQAELHRPNSWDLLESVASHIHAANASQVTGKSSVNIRAAAVAINRCVLLSGRVGLAIARAIIFSGVTGCKSRFQSKRVVPNAGAHERESARVRVWSGYSCWRQSCGNTAASIVDIHFGQVTGATSVGTDHRLWSTSGESQVRSRQDRCTDVLVLDDFAMAPMKDIERRDFLEICDDRYQSRSMVLTSQVPTEHWHEQIGDPTIADSILDRLVHNAHRIELDGESMRKGRGGKPLQQ